MISSWRKYGSGSRRGKTRKLILAYGSSKLQPSSITIFLSDNLSSSSAHVNFHILGPAGTGTLHSFHMQLLTKPYPHHSVSNAYTFSCVAAIPILSSRHKVFDTLIISPEGALSIITSVGRTIPIGVPTQPTDSRDEVAHKLASSLSMVLDADDMMNERSADKKIVELLDPVGPRCTIVFEDGARLRVSADLRITHDLPRQCSEVISYALSGEALFPFKRDLLVQINHLSAVQQGSESAVWTIFHNSVMRMLGFTTKPMYRKPFEALLGEAERGCDPITRRLASAIRQRRPHSDEAPHTEQPHPMSGLESHKLDAASVLLALHLVAQDCRLSATRQSGLSKLAHLLKEIAGRIGRLDWQDYWMRLMPEVCATTDKSDELGESDVENSMSRMFR